VIPRSILIVGILILQVGCSPSGLTLVNSAATPDQPVRATQSPAEPENFQVKVWIDNPTPTLDSRVIVRGSLIRYGHHYIGGIMMSAFWPDAMHERGVPNCYTSVNYGDGKCVIDVSRFSPGKFVPVTISFNYGGKIYTAQTGFTPHKP
jgi:hypothetical protein